MSVGAEAADRRAFTRAVAVATCVALFALAHATAFAALPEFAFATLAEGRAVLGTRDAFVARMSPYDRSARLATSRDVDENAFLAHAVESVRDWAPADRTRVRAALEALVPALAALDLPWPPRVLFVRTSGDEEAQAAYTRGNAVVLPARGPLANLDDAALRHLVAHELFHVLSRQDAAWRDRLYAAIGFRRCGELVLAGRLAGLAITNPDAPLAEHCIRVRVAAQDAWAMPVLYARQPWDAGRRVSHLEQLEARLLLLDDPADSVPRAPRYDAREPRLVAFRDVEGFYDQVGRNTGYVIQPEEIVAENFALLVLGATGVRSPEVIERLRASMHAQRSHDGRPPDAPR